MTTITAEYKQHRSPTGLIFALLVIAVFVALAIPATTRVLHTHVHEEASMIRQCAEAPENLMQVWLNSSGQRLNCLIDLGGGIVGDLVMQWCKRNGGEWMEITAYIIGDGSLIEAIRTMKAKACTKVYP
jgi:hypothetical protein